ncbi:MAG: TadE/TadG family type IV pilus assembly protein [Rhodospirillales bacterium]
MNTTITRDESGVAAVEAALVLPLMLAVSLGGVDLGLGVVDKISLTNAATCGVHYAAHPTGDVAAFTTNRCLPRLISTTGVEVTVDVTAETVTVTVTGDRTPLSPFVPPMTLTATATMPLGKGA